MLSSLRSKQHLASDDNLEPSCDGVSTQIPHVPQILNASQADGALSCTLCLATFQNFTEQRSHIRSDWHGYNLKQKMQGLGPVSEMEFEKMIDDLDMSISGSEMSSSDGDERKDQLSSLLKKQARLRPDAGSIEDEYLSRDNRRGSPLIWFSSSLLRPETSLGIYGVLFSNDELSSLDPVKLLYKKQLKPMFTPLQHRHRTEKEAAVSSGEQRPIVFLCMIGGGHFAAMIVSLTPKLAKNSAGIEERQAMVLRHKTFHRYTTRRKQGGSQSANDASKGNAHSAGAGIRRHNEAALEEEVRALLVEWKGLIDECALLFIRATGNTNRKTLFGPTTNQVLRSNDPRIRSFPFSTRRATQSELMRAFVELTRVKLGETRETTLPDHEKGSTTKPISKPIIKSESSKVEQSKEELEALLHTTQLEALIRRSKAPGVVSYIKANLISPDFTFSPPDAPNHHHASTPLHLAASINSAAVVLALLVKSGADPTVSNGEGKVPIDLVGERATRDAFRVARSELGEHAWDWQKAHCPAPLSKAEAGQRGQADKEEAESEESARRQAEIERLVRERSEQTSNSQRPLPTKARAQEMTAEDRREAEARGLTPEMRAKLERERRARAAEERIKRMTGG